MQYFLQSIIDKYYKCYFIFSTRNKFKINSQIKSRCILLDFFYVESISLYKYISNILKKEKIEYNSKDIFDIINYTNNNVEMSLITTQKSISKKNIILSNIFINKYFIKNKQIINNFINILYSKNNQNIYEIIQDIISNISYNDLLVLLLNHIIS